MIDGYLYGQDGNAGRRSRFRCLDPKDGATVWQASLKFGSPRYADQKIFHLNEKGLLTIMKATSKAYEEISSKKILNKRCWTAPTISGGRLYARDAQGNLVCIDLKG